MSAQIETLHDPLQALEQTLLSMPPVRALGLRIERYDGVSLHLAAPLSANVNDKGSAFGGSLGSLMTLAAWGLTTLKLREAGHRGEVYVQDSQLRYLKPLYDELRIDAQLAADETWSGFLAAYTTRGKARARLTAQARDARGSIVTAFDGRFVALRPTA